MFDYPNEVSINAIQDLINYISKATKKRRFLLLKRASFSE
ncbi:hypothetical protein bthur0013_57040 [Bacillus thuringiensis IBL 200]|nr:hypothetical protein bthur0013_57040 [Bacillus thuringiensis IBL 200]